MKTMASSVVLVLSFALPMAHADDRHHPEKTETSEKPVVSKEKGGMAMDRMQEMRETMDRIHATKDPQERQRLMQEHMEQMGDMMDDMHGMMGKGMGGMPAGDRQQMMEKRMDMMQGMMEQMMEHMMVQGGKTKKEGADQDKQQDHDDRGKRRKLDM